MRSLSLAVSSAALPALISAVDMSMLFLAASNSTCVMQKCRNPKRIWRSTRCSVVLRFACPRTGRLCPAGRLSSVVLWTKREIIAPKIPLNPNGKRSSLREPRCSAAWRSRTELAGMDALSSRRNRLRLYKIAWLPVCALLIYLVVSTGGMGWLETAVLMVPLAGLGQFISLSAWVSCKFRPIQRVPILNLIWKHLRAGLLLGPLWGGMGKFVAPFLFILPLFPTAV